MRELHSTQTILKKLLSQLSASDRIKSVNLVIGEMSELDHNLIEKYWHQLGKDTPAEHAQLHFRSIKAEVQCMACFSKYSPMNGKIYCPHCGSYGAKVLSGEEFHLENYKLDDD